MRQRRRRTFDSALVVPSRPIIAAPATWHSASFATQNATAGSCCQATSCSIGSDSVVSSVSSSVSDGGGDGGGDRSDGVASVGPSATDSMDTDTKYGNAATVGCHCGVGASVARRRSEQQSATSSRTPREQLAIEGDHAARIQA